MTDKTYVHPKIGFIKNFFIVGYFIHRLCNTVDLGQCPSLRKINNRLLCKSNKNLNLQ